MNPAQFLPVAQRAVDIARDMLRDRVPGTVTAKGDRDMVSELDVTIERAVRAFLAEETPDIAFLGEEEGTTGPSSPDMLWALDPIDGTANLVHGIPLCAVSLGLVHQNRSILGVIDLPFLGGRYHAAEGSGAFKGDQRLTTSTTANLRDAIVSIGDYATGGDAERRNRLRLAVTRRLAETAQRVRMFGSAAIDLVWVAEGTIDASVTLSNHPWDTAAGVLIAREAGAAVLDQDGTAHAFNSAATITAAPKLAEHVTALIQNAARQLD